jgi:hypothetical protein
MFIFIFGIIKFDFNSFTNCLIMTLKKQEGVIKGTHREILFDVSYNESFEYN